ncbi:hypothetical protein HAX54_000024 [Datura stramonium]|uniref:Uncharacterized protein n=1 Tax=Datura stramonium TaxID=4076 RepID=A0ABS8RFN2_DATST|nr:hypothetical protein [Datura stramonium]
MACMRSLKRQTGLPFSPCQDRRSTVGEKTLTSLDGEYLQVREGPITRDRFLGRVPGGVKKLVSSDCTVISYFELLGAKSLAKLNLGLLGTSSFSTRTTSTTDSEGGEDSGT